MSFRCKNGTEHTHQTIEQSKICWGIIKPAPVPTPAPKSGRPATAAQINFATNLGGDSVRISGMDFYTISSYIDELKRAGATVGSSPIVDPKLEFAKGMLASTRDGYYAVRPDPGLDEVFFLRVSRPKSGHMKDALKVQTMHGTAAAKPSLMDALVVWQSTKYTFYGRYRQDHWRQKLVESIMMLVTDTIGAARAYAELIGRCCRCNAALTDERSRHYGIGPECEKHMPWIIEAVDASDAAKR